jgi:predicted ferric reductase
MEREDILRPLYKLRWILSRPLQINFLPKWVPVINLPFLKHLPYITIGNIALAVPMLIIFVIGWVSTFFSPSIDGSGYAATYAIIFAFLLANKSNSIFTFLFGMSFERLVPYHNFASLLALVLSFFHGYVAFVHGGDDSGDGNGSRDRRLSSDESQYSLPGPNTDLWKYFWDGTTNKSGSLIIVCMIGLVSLSFFRVFRKYNFDLWLISHIVFAVGVIFFCLVHSVAILILVLLWWIVDLLLRYFLMMACHYPGKAVLTKLSDDLVEIRLSKKGGNSLRFEAGQFIRIAVPEIGSMQFHACTISSAPYEKDVTLHFKVLGDWTRRLMELTSRKHEISVLLEGPYGSLSMDLVDDQRYPMVLCVGGGIGITPCRSITRQLLHENQCKGRKLSKLHVVWTIRDVDLLEALPLLDDSVSSSGTDNSLKEVNLYDDAEAPSSKEGNTRTGGRSLQTDIFLTKASDNEQGVYDGSHSIHLGRPNLSDIFDKLRDEALLRGVTHIAVVGCGPASLVDDVKDLCRSHSKYALESEGVCFDFHEDLFAY